MPLPAVEMSSSLDMRMSTMLTIDMSRELDIDGGGT
jgi:hypothetical protein